MLDTKRNIRMKVLILLAVLPISLFAQSPTLSPSTFDGPSIAPTPRSTCYNTTSYDDDSEPVDVSIRGLIGSVVGIGYFIIMCAVSRIRNKLRCCGRDWWLLVLAAVGNGLSTAYLGRFVTAEEECEYGAGTYLVADDSFVSAVVLYLGVLEFIFDVVCCCGDEKRDKPRSYTSTRLLGPHSGERNCRWWTVSLTALLGGLLGVSAISADIMLSDKGKWAIYIFAVWEISAFGFCYLGGLTSWGWFSKMSVTKVWSAVKLLMVDITGLTSLIFVTEMPSLIPPVVAQGIIEALLFYFEDMDEKRDDDGVTPTEERSDDEETPKPLQVDAKLVLNPP